jgi:hypothetical protein
MPDEYTRRRHDDLGGIGGALNVLISRYRGIATVVGIVVTIAAWLGAVYVGPGKRIDVVEAKINEQTELTARSLAIERARQDTLSSNMMMIQQMLKIVTIDICIRRASDPYVFMQMGCANYNIPSSK